MAERHKQAYLRPEMLEKQWSTESLVQHWPLVHEVLAARLATCLTEDDFVDIISGASLRAGTASSRRDLGEWKRKWYSLKYDAVVLAAEYKREGILHVEFGNVENTNGEPAILVEFGTKPIPYQTVAPVGVLKRKLNKHKFVELFGDVGANPQVTASKISEIS